MSGSPGDSWDCPGESGEFRVRDTSASASCFAPSAGSGCVDCGVKGLHPFLHQQMRRTDGLENPGSGGVCGCAEGATVGRRTSVGPPKYRSVSSSATEGDEGSGVVFLKPLLRGKIHLLLLVLSPLWLFMLFSKCVSLTSFVAAAIAGLSFVSNFLASAMLHCFEWGPNWKRLVKKLDHAGIFMMISGSTTPIPMLLLDRWTSVGLMLVQATATFYGFWLILFGGLSDGARKQRAYTYVFVGLLHAFFMVEYCQVLTSEELASVVILALLYVTGALVYGFQWPDPCPRVLGFHEIFHLCCLGSFGLTLWLDWKVISRAEAQWMG